MMALPRPRRDLLTDLRISRDFYINELQERSSNGDNPYTLERVLVEGYYNDIIAVVRLAPRVCLPALRVYHNTLSPLVEYFAHYGFAIGAIQIVALSMLCFSFGIMGMHLRVMCSCLVGLHCLAKNQMVMEFLMGARVIVVMHLFVTYVAFPVLIFSQLG